MENHFIILVLSVKKPPDQILKRFYRRELSSSGINGQTLALGCEGMLTTFEACQLRVITCAKRLWRELTYSPP
jgi:hypothetical protein